MGPRVPFAPPLLTLSLHITLHIYFISSRLFILLYVTCVMVNKAVKKNASPQLIFCAPKHCHIMPLLLRLHWLPIRLRIEFKILLITCKVLQGSAPKYLIDLISVLPPSCYDLR